MVTLPNPSTLEVLIHYCITSAPSPKIASGTVQTALAFLLHHEMVAHPDSHCATGTFVITAKGRVFVEHLLSLPLPVAQWVMPDARS